MSGVIEFNKMSVWESHLSYIDHVIDYDWPDSAIDYIGSSWDSWEKRIKNGHAAEIEALQQRQKKLEAEGYHKDAYFEYGDWICEEHCSMCLLTNSMYAALTVSLWARVETYLTELTWMCIHAIYKKEDSLKTVLQSDNETLSRKIDKSKQKEQLEELDNLRKKIPSKFEMRKEYYKKNLNIKFQEFANYKIVNAIRILNNHFKHNNGKYSPKSNKLDDCIDQTLLTKWDIISDRNEIDYSKLPFRDLVMASSAFRKELVEKIKKELPCKIKEVVK